MHAQAAPLDQARKLSFPSILNKIESYLIVLSFSYFTLIIIVEVFRRFALHSSSTWGEETARYAFVYMCYIGAAEAVKTRAHLKIDMLQRRMKEWQLFISYLVTDILFMYLAIVVVRFSMEVVSFHWVFGTKMQGLDWNLALAYGSVPIGWTLITIRLFQRFYKTISEFVREGKVNRYGGGMLDEEEE
jgi:C4-dicarboxylate transporter, DctQ subunit